MMDIRLEGVLAKRFGGHYQLNVKNVNEAIRSLCQLVPGFREFMTSAHEHGIYFQIKRNNSTATSYDEMALGCSEFVLVPVITGALFGGKGFSFGLIAVGVLLLALALPGVGLMSFGAAGTISAGFQSAMLVLGAGLIFTGISGLMAPGVPEEGKQEGSEADDAVFGGGAKTSTAGTPIPLLYGTHLANNMPIVSSYIQEEEGYLLAIISEGPIEGFPNGSSEDIYFNGLRASSTAIDNIQVTDGTQDAVRITGVKSAGFHLGIGSTLQTPGDNDPNPQVIRSFAQTSADELKIRLTRGPCYQVRTRSPKDGGSTDSKYRDYDERPHDDDRYDDRPKDADGNYPIQPLQYVLRVYDGDGDAITDSEGNDSFDVIERQLKARKLQIRTYNITNKPVPISIQLTRLDKSAAPDADTFTGGANQYNFQWAKGDVQLVSADVTWAEKLIYPGTSLVGVRFEASEFNQMPSLQVLMKGLKVPVLSSSLRVSYAHSDNPVYVLLDLLTNPRYGLGRSDYTTTHPTTPVDRSTPGISMNDIDLASFYTAAQYCDERVNGKKRFTFNAYINSKADALDLVRSVASSFHGSLVYAGGYVTLVLDRKVLHAQSSIHRLFRLYSEANVIQEVGGNGQVTAPCFSYEGTGRQARTSVVEVSWINPSEFYKENKEVVEDSDAIQRYGYNHKSLRAMGCTDREQARRLGRYVLGSNILSTETVSFKVATEGAMLLPGDIVVIADPLKTQISSGGRIVSANSTRLTVDRDLGSHDLTKDWYVYTYGDTGIAQRNKVSTISNRDITIENSFTSTPSSAQMFILVDEDDENTFRRYRVQSVKESGDGTFSVVAILYVERKFDFIEDGELFDSNSGIGYGSSTTVRATNSKVKRSSIQFTINNATT